MTGRDADLRTRPERFLNRELSWLEFNARVLALAEDPARPLLERAKFCAIFSSNLDEYFQVRVSGLQEQVDLGVRSRSPDGLDAAEAVRAIREQVRSLVERQTTIFTKDIAPALEEQGIGFPDWDDLDDDDRNALRREFEERVYPVLTPLAVDPAHPFPYISNLSLNLAVVVRNPDSGEDRFARVKVPPALPRFVPLPDGERFVPLEQLIATHLDRLFPGMEILTHHPFRVTRDADFELDDEAADLLDAIETVLHRRTKFGQTIRLEIDSTMTDDVLDVLSRELQVPPGATVVIDGPLDLTGLLDVYALDHPELKAETWAPQTQSVLAGDEVDVPDVFRILRAGDVLVHHPYDSFATSVEAFVKQAARDPQVLAIKQTIYRTAGAESGIVESLVEAAREDKQVVALVELKARFDEEANIERAQILEEAGVHVVYGLVGLKTHTKVLLVVRQDEDGVIRRYCHVGTGNYNPKTATIYEDLGLLTCDADVGTDLTELFNHLTGYSRPSRYRRLLVAPEALRSGLRDRIRAEAAKGSDGRIVLKMNSLVDAELIDELYDASAAGTQIDLIVRGICCLRPQVPGLSDNIRVRSILGYYLEHSRIYRFGADPDIAEYLIGSADWMPRNLDRRVEALCAVDAPPLRARLAEILEVNLADDLLAWELTEDGSWRKVPTIAGIDTHVRLRELAEERARPRVSADQLREREVKLAVPPDFELPPLTDPGGDVFAAPEETIHLQATYFDTEDLRLSRAGASLRSRDDGWTVKLAPDLDGDALVRDEHTIPSSAGGNEPPEDALDLVRALTRGAPVSPVAVLRTERKRVRLRSSEARLVGEVVDDRVEVREPDSEEVTGAFREIEVELPDAATASHRSVVLARLRGAGAGAVDPTPKIVRALGPIAKAPPDVTLPEIGDSPSLELVAQRAIAASVARLIAHDPGVRLGDDPESVHQARVATRRLRSDLRTFKVLLDEQWVDALRDELRWLGDVLGGVRDADVLLQRLGAGVPDLPDVDEPAAERLLDRLREERTRAVAQLLTALRSSRYDTVLDHLVAAAQRPRLLLRVDDADDEEAMRELVRRPWEQLARSIEEMPNEPTDTALHEARIRTKRARYAAEAVEPAIGKPARAFARALVSLQDVLGEHQDAVVAGEWLRRAAILAPESDQTFAAGLLAAREADAAQEARDSWRGVWRDVDRKRVRGWL